MRHTLFLTSLAILLLAACAHRDMDSLGYLKPPPELSGYWKNSAQPMFALEFLSDHEFNTLNDRTGIAEEYNTFKIFHIENGMVYAIVRAAWNTNYPDAEMPETDRAQAKPQFLYMKFDLSDEPRVYDPGEAWFYMRVHSQHCETVNGQGIELSEADFNVPASVHWNRLQPGGDCKYHKQFGFFYDSTPYVRLILWPAQ